MQKTMMLFAGSLVLGACAKNSNEIPTTYVPSAMYDSYNCKKLQLEAMRISRRVGELQYRIDEKADGDETATVVGLILLWPALFFIDGDGPETYEYARMKGEMDAIEVASIQKECGFKIQRPPPRKPKTDETPPELK